MLIVSYSGLFFLFSIVFARSNVPLIVCSLASNGLMFLFLSSSLVAGPMAIMALTLLSNEWALYGSADIISKDDSTVDALVKIIASTFFCFNNAVKSSQMILFVQEVFTSYRNNSSTIIPRSDRAFRMNSFDFSLLGIMMLFPFTISLSIFEKRYTS